MVQPKALRKVEIPFRALHLSCFRLSNRKARPDWLAAIAQKLPRLRSSEVLSILIAVKIRFYLDPANGLPHIYDHGVAEEEVEDVQIPVRTVQGAKALELQLARPHLADTFV